MVEDIGNVMLAYKGTQKELLAKERMEREEIELEKAVGFSAVLKKIRNAVIFHCTFQLIFHFNLIIV